MCIKVAGASAKTTKTKHSANRQDAVPINSPDAHRSCLCCVHTTYSGRTLWSFPLQPGRTQSTTNIAAKQTTTAQLWIFTLVTTEDNDKDDGVDKE